MNKIFLIFLLFLNVALAQEPHQKKAKSIEEILNSNNPNAYKALQNKSNYLVIENQRNGKRTKIYEGDKFRFKTKTGLIFQENISMIADSTFEIEYYDQISRHLTTEVFKLSDIEKYYKRDVTKGIKSGISWASLGSLMPLLYDWAYFKIPPTENRGALIGIPLIQAGLTILANKDKYFNVKRFNENRKLKIFKSF